VDKSAGPDACWPWLASTAKGYGQIKDGVRMRKAHRVAYALAHGAAPSELFVCHRCDNPKCVNPAHLFLGTNSDNQLDSSAKGRHGAIKGEAHVNAKLSNDDVAIIKSLRGKVTQRELATRFGVCQMRISQLQRQG